MSEFSSSDELPPVARWKHQFQAASGSREMVEDDDGDWMQYEDMKLAMCFVTGYLREHKRMLERLGVHTKVCASVQHIIDEIEKL